MLRKHVKDRIINIIATSPLTKHAFNIVFQTHEPGFHVDYKLRKDFVFDFGPKQFDEGLSVSRCPSKDLLILQTESVEDIEEAISFLQEWVRWVEVEDDLPANLDSLDGVKEMIFRIIGERIQDEDTFFTREEADELKDRLHILEAKFSELMKTAGAKDSEILTMKKNLDQAGKDTEKMTKRKWKLVGGGKIVDVLSLLFHSPKIKTLAFEEAKKLLGL